MTYSTCLKPFLEASVLLKVFGEFYWKYNDTGGNSSRTSENGPKQKWPRKREVKTGRRVPDTKTANFYGDGYKGHQHRESCLNRR